MSDEEMPAPTIQQRIADNVLAEMARAHMSRTFVADLLGLHVNSVHARLRGGKPFSADEIVRLAAALKVSPATLIDVDTPVMPSRPRGSDPEILGAEVLPGAAG